MYINISVYVYIYKYVYVYIYIYMYIYIIKTIYFTTSSFIYVYDHPVNKDVTNIY